LQEPACALFASKSAKNVAMLFLHKYDAPKKAKFMLISKPFWVNFFETFATVPTKFYNSQFKFSQTNIRALFT
jgi:hypothetical protein